MGFPRAPCIAPVICRWSYIPRFAVGHFTRAGEYEWLGIMSNCVEAHHAGSRKAAKPKVELTVQNPNIRLTNHAIEALARLLLGAEVEAPAREAPDLAA